MKGEYICESLSSPTEQIWDFFILGYYPDFLFYCLIIKGGILDNWHGWYYAF